VVVSTNISYISSSEGAIRRVTPVEEYKLWRRRNPAVGCRFASVITIDPARYGQVFEAVPGGATAARTAENLAKRVTELIDNKGVNAAALLFPSLTTLEETARVMLALGELPMWGVTPKVIQNEVVGKMVALRVIRKIPFGRKTCDSETLVLGDFEGFPATRKSPVTAMEIFVGEPLKYDPKSGQPTTQANLAHIIDRDIYGHKPYQNVWDASHDGRQASLGRDDDNRAKAKVTLVLPIPVARRLGLAT
jgi:hypothetical protein